VEFSEWPNVVDMVEGWFNQPIPAKTATMWYAELRHYDTDRVVAAFGRVARNHISPYLPALGVVLTSIRQDGQGTALASLPNGQRFIRSKRDQFQLTEGGPSEEGDSHDEDGMFARGLICDTPGCGYTPVLAAADCCPVCGGKFMPDGHVLAQGQAGATAKVV
jgi:hypothetical protein